MQLLHALVESPVSARELARVRRQVLHALLQDIDAGRGLGRGQCLRRVAREIIAAGHGRASTQVQHGLLAVGGDAVTDGRTLHALEVAQARCSDPGAVGELVQFGDPIHQPGRLAEEGPGLGLAKLIDQSLGREHPLAQGVVPVR